ncbi:MAG: carbohydrate ABC transporter permease [Clostridiales bacterium]|jgi:multiple sugar transport system permease protein|nr:carbohydrate ABC transporter permease [Clostridiales bacterium]
MRQRSDIGKIAFKTAAYIILAAIALTMIFPYAWMLLTSFKDRIEAVSTLKLKFFPQKFLFGGYSEIFKKIPMLKGVLKTLIVEAAVIPVGTFVSALAAFSFSKLRLPYKTVFLMILMSGTMIPYAALMLPQYRTFDSLGMVNTLWPLILPGFFGNVVMMFFFIQYMKGIPAALVEAAKIDGASYGRIFVTIVLPLMGPALAVQIIFWFTGIWNDFFAPSIYLTQYDSMTLQPMLAKINGENKSGVNLPLIMTGAVLSSVPIMIIYLAFQRLFVESVAISGVKG